MELLAALTAPFTDPASRTYWGGLVVAALLAAAFGRDALRGLGAALRHRSTGLDVQLLLGRQLLRLLGWLPTLAGSWWLATHLVRWLDATVGRPGFEIAPSPWVALAYSVTLFVCWDASRYVLHRAMHEIPALWAFHQVHHSAEVLTPLTFHRVHPVESALYQARSVLVTGLVSGLFFWLVREAAVDLTLLGVNAIGLVANVATGNLRHSHVWLRFGPRIERWLLSPAQHQLHHSADPADFDRNYGTWLAVWDRLGGTLSVAGARAPVAFGIDAGARNHGDDLLSAWFGPFAAVLPRRAAAAALLAVVVPAVAFGQESDDADDEAPRQDDAPEDPEVVPPDDHRPMELIVVADQGVPRVSGSAHVVDEEELELFAHDDVHEVLATVPGVYVRGEDGFGLRPNIGIRGANSDRSAKITLMEDGVLFAPAPYAAPAAYYFPMSARLAGLEVFKGPAAIQHGPHTVGGAVNLLTRPVPTAPTGAVDLAWGLRNTGRVHGYAGTGNERSGLLVEGALLGTRGFKHLDGGGPTGFGRGELMVKGRVGTDPDLSVVHALEIKLGYGAETSHETYLGLTPGDFAADPDRRYAATALGLMEWDRTQVQVAWPVTVGDDLEVRTVAYHHRLSRAWTKLNGFAGGPDLHTLLQQPGGGQADVYLGILRGEEDSVTADQALVIGTNDRRFDSYGVQSRARWRHRAGAFRSALEAGIRVHADDVRRVHTEDPYEMRSGALVPGQGDVVTTFDARDRAVALSAYVHEDLSVGGWHVLPGVRTEVIRTWREDEDHVAGSGTTRPVVLPGLGFLGEIAPDVHVFGGVHRGFSPVAPGQPKEVRPETTWNVEGGFRAGNAFGPRAEVVGFVNRYVNLVGQCTFSGGCDGDDVDRQFNGGRVLVGGLEAVGTHEFLLPGGYSVPLELDYTYTHGRFQTGFVSGFPQFGTVAPGFALPYVPVHQGAARVSLVHPRFRLGVSGTARSGMLDAAGVLPVPDDTGVPALAQLDLAASVQATDRLRVYGTVSNATDARPVVSWRPYGARPAAPRQVMVGLELHDRAKADR